MKLRFAEIDRNTEAINEPVNMVMLFDVILNVHRR